LWVSRGRQGPYPLVKVIDRLHSAKDELVEGSKRSILEVAEKQTCDKINKTSEKKLRIATKEFYDARDTILAGMNSLDARAHPRRMQGARRRD
jgi:hypothetical protein